ncbi:hypothetical protein QJS10_CPA01g02468 [Acorus calamus]|uniref:Uncharacterized protein n=1 Tax=Acorus calamus TaxID=4465 RepID=A0AAV9FK60_ACOCL|nr:hypothetical protein QJS10_CPA01g02468 [Acorus calamus]
MQPPATGAGGAGREGSFPPPPSQKPAVVEDLVASLERRRSYREVTLSLRSGLRDAKAEFSFLRHRGLKNLLRFLQSSASASDDSIRLFRHSQSVPDLQGFLECDSPVLRLTVESLGQKPVVPVLFQNTLRPSKVEDPVVDLDRVFGVEPMKISSPATDGEVCLALRVLEGCCLLGGESKVLAHRYNAISVLMNILSTRGILEQGACLDALISLLLDCSANQTDFEACHSIEKIAEILKDEHRDENIRLKCAEFLLLLIGHVNGREKPPMATIYEDINRLLGEKSASLIWAASQFGSTLDPEQRQTALHIQARRVMESLDFID